MSHHRFHINGHDLYLVPKMYGHEVMENGRRIGWISRCGKMEESNHVRYNTGVFFPFTRQKHHGLATILEAVTAVVGDVYGNPGSLPS